MIQTDAGSLINAAGGLLLVLLAAFVVWISPAQRVNRAFAAFSGGFGVWAMAWNLPERVDPAFSWFYGTGAVGIATAAGGLLALGLLYPRRMVKEHRKIAASALLVAPFALVWVTLAVLRNAQRQAAFGFPRSSWGVALGNEIAGGVFMAAVLFTLLLYAMRYPAAAPKDRIQYALVSAALVVWPGAVNGSFVFLPDGSSHIRSPAFILTLVVVAGLWLHNMQVGPPRQARNVAWTVLAAPLLGLVTTLGLGGWNPLLETGFFGLARTVTVAIFAYAILRHQLLGIEVKVKWTIRQSTLAAIFLAVIFFVSEGAQEIFGDRHRWMGLVAGAALVFVLAPLQRFAERVSDRAMPGVEDTPEYRLRRAREIYRAAVESVGEITDRDRDMLAALQEQLGLKPTEARALEKSQGWRTAQSP